MANGALDPDPEQPKRIEVLRRAAEAAGCTFVPPQGCRHGAGRGGSYGGVQHLPAEHLHALAAHRRGWRGSHPKRPSCQAHERGEADGLGLPTLFVQEGGYLSDALGDNLIHVPQGFIDA
jgi:hypothetical protein